MTKVFTKITASFENPDIHPLPMPPPGSGAPTPQKANHPNTCGRVIITMAQNIHFENPPPPTENEVVPSRRSAIPARTSATREAGAASASRNRIASSKSCGTAIPLPPVWKLGGPVPHETGQPTWLLYRDNRTSRNAAATLGDPELDQPGDTGDGE